VCKGECVNYSALCHTTILIDLNHFEQPHGGSEFQRVEEARLNMMAVISQLFANANVFGPSDVACQTLCHRQNHELK
jgi:hypothetical protein